MDGLATAGPTNQLIVHKCDVGIQPASSETRDGARVDTASGDGSDRLLAIVDATRCAVLDVSLRQHVLELFGRGPQRRSQEAVLQIQKFVFFGR
jgi:hypothetical protein